jgi:hypothetical protein
MLDSCPTVVHSCHQSGNTHRKEPEAMSADKHRRWTTVLDNSAADRQAGRDMTGWVGVSEATDAEFKAGNVHGRNVDADEHCTPDCPAKH